MGGTVENLLNLRQAHSPDARATLEIRQVDSRSLLPEMGVGRLRLPQVKLATGLAGFSN